MFLNGEGKATLCPFQDPVNRPSHILVYAEYKLITNFVCGFSEPQFTNSPVREPNFLYFPLMEFNFYLPFWWVVEI